jgi:cell division FtsZ-interacting protein ZapD
VVARVNESLDNINQVSRQLLSCILAIEDNTKENQQSAKAQHQPNTNAQITDNELTQLMSKREQLIKGLFEQHTPEAIAQELTLVTDMLSLDSQLSSQASAYKTRLAAQVMQLKKSKKVTQSYQRY